MSAKFGKFALAILFNAVFVSIFPAGSSLQIHPAIPPGQSRRGAKYVEGQRPFSPKDIPSPTELQELARLNALRTPGSLRYYSSWRDWSRQSLGAIRYHLSQNLPHEADPRAFSELFFALGTAADLGEMPSFADAGSRSGYALEFFCRARLLADLLYEKYNPSLSLPVDEEGMPNDVYHKKYYSKYDKNSLENGSQNICNVMSLGGGPGYDFVGIFLADTFGTSGYGNTRILGTVFDYEEGWKDVVEAMDVAINLAFPNEQGSTLIWGGQIDITKPLTDPCNQACLNAVPISDVFICQYCVAENVRKLRDSSFAFFADLFHAADNRTVFIFTETTPRIWPDIVDLVIGLSGGGNGFEINFVRHGSGTQMVIQKRDRGSICQDALVLCEHFRTLGKLHERKIDKGFQRQPKKIRGGKIAGDASWIESS